MHKDLLMSGVSDAYDFPFDELLLDRLFKHLVIVYGSKLS